MCLRERGVGSDCCLVLADCPRQIAVAIQCQTTRQVRGRIVAKRTHLHQYAIRYARPSCAELARTGE